MAFTVTKPITEAFDPNATDNAGGFGILSGANNNVPAFTRMIVTNMNGGKPTFVTELTTTGSDTTGIASSNCTLAALGVSFPANTMRAIYTRVFSRLAGATAAGYAERVHLFLGNAAIGAVTTATEAVTTALATNMGIYIPVSGALTATQDVVASHAYVDGAAGPFLTVFKSTTAAFDTPLGALATRMRFEVYVGSLVVFPTF